MEVGQQMGLDGENLQQFVIEREKTREETEKLRIQAEKAREETEQLKMQTQRI